MKLCMMTVLIIISVIIGCCTAAITPMQEAIPFGKTLPGTNTINVRIVNGFPATANQIPYQCSVMSPVAGGFTVCGCSIISVGWTLSAAHCIIDQIQFNLRFGTLNLQTGGIAQTSFTAYYHQQYNAANLNNDVSLVQIPTPLTLTPAIQTIRLATITQQGNTFIGTQSRVSGWGQTHIGPGVSQTLNWVWINPISNAQCSAVYGTAVIVPHVLCGIGWDNPNQGHCGGDSGGPLAIDEAGTWTQIGVTSFGAAAGCTLGFPDGYMRTSHFANWVAEHTGIAARP